MNSEYVACAEKGLVWLKESGPFYGLDVNRINIEFLKISDCTLCALGQASGLLCGGYNFTVDKLRDGGVFADQEEAFIPDWLIEHGFELSMKDRSARRYPGLTEAWKHVLTQDRRGA